jgi:serralysin
MGLLFGIQPENALMSHRVEPASHAATSAALVLTALGMLAQTAAPARERTAAHSAASLESVHTQSTRTPADSLGIVTHLDYHDTPYGDINKVKAALAYLGIQNIRDMMPRFDSKPYRDLAALGYHFDLVVRSEAANELPQTIQQLEAFERLHPGAIGAIEGLNEANNWPAAYHGLTGFPAAVTLQHELYAAVKGSDTLHNVPVYAMTLGGAQESDYDRLGDLSAYADMANVHIYFPKGRPPSSVWDGALALNRRSTPHLAQTVITETGYSTAVNSEHRVSEDIQAKYLLTLICHAWQQGIRQLFIYALVDDSTNYSDWTRGLGLYRYDWTPKPAAVAIHNWMLALKDAPARTGITRPGSLSYHLSSAQAGVATLLFQKSDATFVLLIWREQPLWDSDTFAPLQPRSVRLSATFEGHRTRVKLLDALTGRQQSRALLNGRIELDLTDAPLWLEIPPAPLTPTTP